jgi:hypothetical protein
MSATDAQLGPPEADVNDNTDTSKQSTWHPLD